MKKIILSIVGLILSTGVLAETNAGAGQKWYGPYTLAKVARYWDGTHKMSVHVQETPDTSCDITNHEKKFTYHPNDDIMATYLFSAAAAAQAQNKKVMLLIANTCHNIYGLNLVGVEIISE
ncbi:TPA: hypothetical protein I7747_09700 [Vibrio vulnificus]|uniref:hypothetical protein n=1 Tax=Vibrio vulnificus TaxID=672 RepID=UPI001302C724|nr:hypothetical protein [Vibrio vulnificus]MCU8207062.1 hypothetical protein [Vibrio vulnificus]HAS8422877.1 hypothetical protein [Vibrio vulnificus]